MKYDIEHGITSVSEFRQDAKSHLTKLKKSNQPLILTQNGRSAAVLLSPKDYQRLEYERDLYKAIAEGERDVSVGRVVDHDDLFRELLK